MSKRPCLAALINCNVMSARWYDAGLGYLDSCLPTLASLVNPAAKQSGFPITVGSAIIPMAKLWIWDHWNPPGAKRFPPISEEATGVSTRRSLGAGLGEGAKMTGFCRASGAALKPFLGAGWEKFLVYLQWNLYTRSNTLKQQRGHRSTADARFGIARSFYPITKLLETDETNFLVPLNCSHFASQCINTTVLL